MFINCLSKGTSDAWSNFKHFNTKRDFRHEISDRNNIATKKFIELNNDVLFNIINELNLEDFLTLVKTNSHLSFLAGNSFRRRYRNYKFTILNGSASGFVENHFDKHVEIYDLPSTVEILKNFGHWINRLDIQNSNISMDFSITIDQLINRHCAGSLKYLNLGYLDEYTLGYLTQPFKKVEELTLSVKGNAIRSGFLLFNRLFPRLRHLRLILNSNIDYSFITFEYPHLDYLSMVVSNDVWKRKERIEGLLRKNPQIRSIKIQYGPMDYAKDINQFLPKLENLSLHTFDLGKNYVHFENVRNFVLSTRSPRSIENLSFARLETLKMEYSSAFFDEWVAFFKQHSNLSSLHLTDYYSEGSVPLVELTTELPNLNEVVMECSNSIGAEAIGEFIKSHRKLTKFQFSFNEFAHDDVEVLKKRFERDWHIHYFTNSFSWVGVTFERIE